MRAEERTASPAPEAATTATALETAEATERGLREQINDLVKARARADSEQRRLQERLRLREGEPMLATVADRYARQSERLRVEIESLRASLREQEATTESVRADEAGA